MSKEQKFKKWYHDFFLVVTRNNIPMEKVPAYLDFYGVSVTFISDINARFSNYIKVQNAIQHYDDNNTTAKNSLSQLLTHIAKNEKNKLSFDVFVAKLQKVDTIPKEFLFSLQLIDYANLELLWVTGHFIHSKAFNGYPDYDVDNPATFKYPFMLTHKYTPEVIDLPQKIKQQISQPDPIMILNFEFKETILNVLQKKRLNFINDPETNPTCFGRLIREFEQIDTDTIKFYFDITGKDSLQPYYDTQAAITNRQYKIDKILKTLTKPIPIWYSNDCNIPQNKNRLIIGHKQLDPNSFELFYRNPIPDLDSWDEPIKQPNKNWYKVVKDNNKNQMQKLYPASTKNEKRPPTDDFDFNQQLPPTDEYNQDYESNYRMPASTKNRKPIKISKKGKKK